MKSTIDSAGRIVIPRDIRAAAGLEAGTVVEIDVRDGVVSIEPAASTVRLVKRGRLTVAATESDEPLTIEVVSRIRDDIRKRR